MVDNIKVGIRNTAVGILSLVVFVAIMNVILWYPVVGAIGIFAVIGVIYLYLMLANKVGKLIKDGKWKN